MKTNAKENRQSEQTSERLRIPISDHQPVSGLLDVPTGTQAGYVLAHGAGAGMHHPFLSKVAAGLAQRGIGTLRYQFPYMEKGSGRPDRPAVAQSAVRAAVAEARTRAPKLAWFAGGKSFGGRMTSQAQAAAPLEGVRGLIFLAFPLHPPGKPSDERAQHLFQVSVPMLFLQGDRDEFAHLPLLQGVTDRLGARATLRLFAQADHSFHVPARTGKTDAAVMDEMLDAIQGWMKQVLQQGEVSSVS